MSEALELSENMKTGFYKYEFLSLALLLLCFTAKLAARRANLAADEAALLAIKTHLSLSHDHILASNWTTTVSVCQWVGVSCGHRHERVIALDLSNMGLNSAIPPYIGNLSFLAYIDLSQNSFHGGLPHELGQLRRLKLLSFEDNDLSGEVPSWFGMPKLQYVGLDNNSFEGTIPLALFNAPKLEILSLDFNSLEGSIPHDIGKLTNLNYLSFEKNRLSGSLPLSVFTNMTSLQTIDFSYNSLSGSLPDRLCDSLGNLEFFSVSENDLDGHLPTGLENCDNLQTLDLSRNAFTGNIPRSIGNLTRLEQLLLHDNKLEGVVVDEIGDIRSLEVLDLGNNSLTGHLPPSIFNISTAEAISLVNNSLSGRLPSNIGHGTPMLKELYLWENDLSGTIPDSISNASRLETLELGNNFFSGNIPCSITGLRYLRELRLYINNFTVDLNFISSLRNCKHLRALSLSYNPFQVMIPNSISNLSKSLEYFDAYGCGLSGEIPQGIGNLSNLLHLDIGQNEITGYIPMAIGRLKKLQGLMLPQNKLKGPIPFELCNLKALTLIQLEGNTLTGGIPACLSNLTSLRGLYLQSNNISSSIPMTFWSVIYMLDIDISSNSLVGSLPAEIGNLKVLLGFDASNNKLSGTLPNSFQNLQDLGYIVLANNDFHGSIPESFGELKSLEELDLSRNALSGVIPKSLEKVTYLKEFNVSFNNLEGEIPTGGVFRNLSTQSFLGNYALCGPPKQKCRNKTLSSSKPFRKYYILAAAIAAALTITVIAIISAKRWKKRNTNATDEENPSPFATWTRISLLELQRATDSFDEANLLGVGAFGTVYKGTLSDGNAVAVKTFNMDLEEGFKSFDVECEVFREFRHRNLVKVISCCCNVDFKALVLEYMPKGSLEKWLYSHNYFLDIVQRLNIMIDVGAALEHLHNGHSSPVVHCDLKPSNVLLDEDMVAHVSDFGIAKLLGEGKSMTDTLTLATVGYMAPEYGSSGTISTKGDVYSFGILVMEMFTRKKPTDAVFGGETNLKRWVKDSLPDAVAEVVDENLLRQEERTFDAKINCVSSLLQLGVYCCADSPEDRGNMKDVLAAMTKIRAKFLKDIRRWA